MSIREKIFHDSWYRISDQRITIRPSVRIHRQTYRGELWFVLHDPFTNQFFRFPPEVYEFIARMSPRKTVEEIWNELLTLMPDSAPTQGNIIDLLAQLYQSNLIHSNLSPDSVRLFERFEKREKKKIKAQFLNLLFTRIPIYDPHNFLKSITPLINILISPVGLALWLLVVGFGVKCLLENFGLAVQRSQGLLAPSNLVLFYISIIFIKLFHEFGHSAAVRRFGGEVHTLGVMFLMLTPLPYMDATAAWAFRNKWKRVLVGASGMLFELFIASLAIIVWANTGDGVLSSIAYNMAVIASVSSLVFNLNPLLKYDGYYMLSDLIDTPNLQMQAQKERTHTVEKYLFGRKDSASVASSKKESVLLVFYNILSSIYRFFVFGGILFFISTKHLLLAVFIGVYLLITWLLVPVIKGVTYLATNPGIARVRGRAIQVTLVSALLVTGFLTLVPFPLRFKSPGVLKAKEYQNITNATAGVVASVHVESGKKVKKGDTLFILHNRELQFRRQEAVNAIKESEANYRKALFSFQEALNPLSVKRRVLWENLDHIDSQLTNLTIRAPFDGVWYSPDAELYLSRWIPRGTQIGQLINEEKYFFISAVPQKEIGQLFSLQVTKSRIRLKGQAHSELSIDTMIIIPMELNRLPSSALGLMGGGDIMVKGGDTSGVTTAEPFYEVRVGVVPSEGVAFLHGRTGSILYSLGEQPLFGQLIRKIRQLIQKNYKV